MSWVSEMHTQERVLCSGVFVRMPVLPVTEGPATDWYCTGCSLLSGDLAAP